MKRYWFGLFAFAFCCVSFVWAQTPSEFKGHDGLIHAVAFSNDGTVLATASVDGTVKLWNYSTGKETQILKGAIPSAVNSVAFNKDGSIVATGSADKIIRLWNPKDGKVVKELKGHTDGVSCVAFSPDGALLASTGGDKSVRLWEVKDGKELKNLGSHKKSVYWVAFNKTGSELASCGDDGVIKVWDVKKQVELKSMMVDLPKPAVTVEPKKEEPKKEVKDKKEAKKKKDMTKKEAAPEIRDAFMAVAFTPDGKYILSGGQDKYLRYWSLADGKEAKKFGPTRDWIFAVTVSKDGKKVATAGYGGSLRVYEIDTGKEIYDDVKAKQERKYQITYGAVFTPDGKAIVTAQDMKGKGIAKVTPITK